MIEEFARKSPKAASVLIYLGYAAGGLCGMLLGYLISGVPKTWAILAFGSGCGVLALQLARGRGVVPQPSELNRPITLFGREER
jgi:hypothetical protein